MQWSSLLLVNSIVIVTGSETSHWRPVTNARVCLHEEVVVDVPVQSFDSEVRSAGGLEHIVMQSRTVAMAKLSTRYPLGQTIVYGLKIGELVVVHEKVFLPRQGGQQQQISEVSDARTNSTAS